MIEKEKIISYFSIVIRLSYLIFIFSLASSLLYLWGYWGKFSINILEFMLFEDVVKLSLHSLAGILMALSISLGVHYLLIERYKMKLFYLSNNEEDSKEQNKKERESKFSKRLLLVVGIITPIGISGLVIFPYLWVLIVPFVLAMIIFIIFDSSNILGKNITNSPFYTMMISIIVAFPFLAYTYGVVNATVIKDDIMYKTVDISRLNIGEENKKLKLIGVVGGHIFLQPPNNKHDVYIVSHNKLPYLQINTSRWNGRKHFYNRLKYLKNYFLGTQSKTTDGNQDSNDS